MNLPVVYKLVLKRRTEDCFFSILNNNNLLTREYRLDQWTETFDLFLGLVAFSTFRCLQRFTIDNRYGYYGYINKHRSFVLYEDWKILKCVTDSMMYYSPFINPGGLYDSWNINHVFYTSELLDISRRSAYSRYISWHWPEGTVFCRRLMPIEVIDNDNIFEHQCLDETDLGVLYE